MRLLVASIFSACCLSSTSASQNPVTVALKAEYDTAKVTTLTGNVAQIDFLGADTALMLMTRVPGVGAWAVEGDSRAALERAGWEFRVDIATVPANTQATVSVYLPSDGSPAQARLMQLIEGSPLDARARSTHTSLLKNRRFAYGLELTLADGRKLPFGNRR